MRPDGNRARPAPVTRNPVCMSGWGCMLDAGHKGDCRDLWGENHPRSEPVSFAMPIQPQPRAVRRAELLSLLRLPANARLQFGGREWLQDFDDEACLIVTVPR